MLQLKDQSDLRKKDADDIMVDGLGERNSALKNSNLDQVEVVNVPAKEASVL